MSSEPLIFVCGRVTHGAGRGKTLGFPTLNVPLTAPYPRFGVYCAHVVLPDGQESPALVNIGVHPTFDTLEAPVAECNLWEPCGDLYGQIVTVHLLHFLREEKRFSDVCDLKRQVDEDRILARQFFEKEDQ